MKGWEYVFTLKSGRPVFYKKKTKEWAIENDHYLFVEPTNQETNEIISYVVANKLENLLKGGVK